MPFADYVRAAVVEPLGLGLDPSGHPGPGCTARSTTCSHWAGAARAAPRRAETHEEMTSVQFPGLDGVLPDYGRFSPLDWGLGVELKGDEGGALVGRPDLVRGRSATSAGAARSSGSTPTAASRAPASTTRPFGEWAKGAWPRLSDAVVRELG